MKRPIYLDHHATTAVDPRVLEAMLPYFCERFGNAGSGSHAYGWEAVAAIDRAREQTASLLGSTPEEIHFTSGATESNSIALLGTTLAYEGKDAHVVSCATEHPAVLDTLAWLAPRGVRSTILPVDEHGLVTCDAVASALEQGTVLVTLMMANNEIGTIQPIAEIGRLLNDRGIRFHCDAAQAVGRIPVDVEELGADLLSLSAHKFHGPKGVGALHVRRGMKGPRLVPLHHGGGQEGGLRPGTSNVTGAIGLGMACEVCSADLPTEMEDIRGMRDDLETALRSGLPETKVNGHPEKRLPGNLSMSFPGIEAEALMLALPNLALSAGSACSSGSGKTSHVLRAIGLSDALARSTLRFGLGRQNDAEDALVVGESVVRAARELGSGAP